MTTHDRPFLSLAFQRRAKRGAAWGHHARHGDRTLTDWVCWAHGVEPVAYSDVVPLGSHEGATHVPRRSGHHCRGLDRNRPGPARLEAQEYMITEVPRCPGTSLSLSAS